jgi:hypothetical protein
MQSLWDRVSTLCSIAQSSVNGMMEKRVFKVKPFARRARKIVPDEVLCWNSEGKSYRLREAAARIAIAPAGA